MVDFKVGIQKAFKKYLKSMHLEKEGEELES